LKPIDPKDFEPEDVGPVTARAAAAGDEKTYRKALERSVGGPLGIRAFVGKIAGKGDVVATAKDAPMFRLEAKDGATDVSLDVKPWPEKGHGGVTTEFALTETTRDGEVAIGVSVSADGTLRTSESPGGQILSLGD